MHTTTSSCCICLFTAASIDTDLIQSIRNVITAMDHRRHKPTHHLFQQHHMCNNLVSSCHCIQHAECPVAVGCKSSSRCRLSHPNRYGQGLHLTDITVSDKMGKVVAQPYIHNTAAPIGSMPWMGWRKRSTNYSNKWSKE